MPVAAGSRPRISSVPPAKSGRIESTMPRSIDTAAPRAAMKADAVQNGAAEKFG